MTHTGYIYKLAIKDGSLEECYIGSTSRIRQRKINHKALCNCEKKHTYNYYVYQFIRENGGFDNWDLYELEKVEYTDKIQLLKKEREWIEKLKPSLNKQVPTQTKKEYGMTYFQNNKKNIYDKQKAKNIKYNCMCGSVVHHNTKHKHIKTIKHQKYISDTSI